MMENMKTKKRFTLEMQYWKGNPQGRKLVDNLTGQDEMSVEELCDIASALHCKCEELESVNEVYENSLNKLEDENNELKKQREELFIRERDTKNELREVKKQMRRLYNYFWDWHSDEMGGNQFSEMWDMVKEEEKWDYDGEKYKVLFEIAKEVIRNNLSQKYVEYIMHAQFQLFFDDLDKPVWGQCRCNMVPHVKEGNNDLEG